MSNLANRLDERELHEDEHASMMTGTDWDRDLVLTPNPPGFWLVVLGVAVMALGPLFGFLAGTTIPDATAPWGLSPIWFGMIVGIAVGGIGMAMLAFGVVRWRKHAARKDGGEES